MPLREIYLFKHKTLYIHNSSYYRNVPWFVVNNIERSLARPENISFLRKECLEYWTWSRFSPIAVSKKRCITECRLREAERLKDLPETKTVQGSYLKFCLESVSEEKLSKIIWYCCQIASRTPNLLQNRKIVKDQTLYRHGWANLWILANVLMNML